MADKAQKKEETKKQLRALLLSAPAALTANELKRDYHDFMGDPIPFRELGYTTLEDLLKDMPDALRVSWKNGVMCLEPVAQEASVHIQKLVSKQKVNNKNKWATLRNGGPSTRSRGPPQPRSFRSYNSNRHQLSHAPPRNTRPNRPNPVSAYIRKQISELLKSYPNGLPLTHFDTAFSRRFGVPLSPSGLGFDSMKDLLDSLPDIAKLKEFQGGEWRVAPAYIESREQVPRYKPPHLSDRKSDTNKGFNRQPEQSRDFRTASEPIRKYNRRTERTDQSQINFQPAGIEEGDFMEDIHCQIPQQDFIAIPGRENTGKKSLISPGGATISPPSAPHAPRGRGRRRTGDRGDVDVRSQGRDSVSSGGSLEVLSSPGAGEFDVSVVSEVVQNNIRQILEEQKEGVWAIQLPAKYMKRCGKELSFRDYGYWSLVEMLASLPQLMRLERPTDNGDWLCFDARLPVPKKTVVQKQKPDSSKRETVSKGRYSSRGELDSQMEEKIRQVLQCKPRGVPLNEFSNLYKDLTGEVLPFRELGYDKIEFFMIPLADSVLHLEYMGDGCMMVYAMDNGKPPRRDLIINPPKDEVSTAGLVRTLAL
ncbi:tudor domain-containing protein 5-like, partial [Mizuhopecten yessoensis]|uniref:tudor domain-containing protein 5-like n=1 Tax=Mizuhopecten yessoensis TaxID=6573 RepID=UPI000B45973B